MGTREGRRRWYAQSLVRAVTAQLVRHNEQCEICRLVQECEHRQALRWYRGQLRRVEAEEVAG